MKLWHCIIIVILVSIIAVGCASGKIQAGKDIKIADTVKVAEEINPKAKVVAGVDKSANTETKQSAGRDFSQVNDTEMIKELIRKNEEASAKLNNIFKAIILALLSQMIILIKWQGNMFNKLLEAKQKWVENLIKSNEAKDKINDDWLRNKVNGGGK